MKKLIVILFLILTSLQVGAQKWLKTTRPIQVGVIAYNAKGEMNQGQGVLSGEGDFVLTEYDILKGASRIIVVGQEQEVNVSSLGGASSLYNVARLILADKPKKFASPERCERPLNVGETVYILPTYNADKKAVAVLDTVCKIETFKEKFNYYTLTKSQTIRQQGAAVFTADGKLVGMLQAPSRAGEPACVMDINFPDNLAITPLGAKHADLMSIDLPLEMPKEESQAATFLYLVDKTNVQRYQNYIKQFISLYPMSTTGYVSLSEAYVAENRIASADSVYEAALQVDGIAKDELLYSRSVLVSSLCLTNWKDERGIWSLDYALQQTQEATALHPLPTYRLQEANCLYNLKKYNEASLIYNELTGTNLRSVDLYIKLANCKQHLEEPVESLIALMDSAMTMFPPTLPAEAAPIVLRRAVALAEAGKHRDAVADYNKYEHLVGGKVTAAFCYQREQSEVKCRMYPAALSDIERAIQLQPKECLYLGEAASLNYRIGEVDAAIGYANVAIEQDGEFADAYRILGVCYKQKNDKAKAKQYLESAKTLGDTIAAKILDEL